MIIHVLRKPLTGTVAANVLAHGCGTLNIDECRIGIGKRVPSSAAKDRQNVAKGAERGRTTDTSGFDPNVGRWPTNFVLTHLPACEQVGVKKVRSKQLTAGNRTVESGRGWGVQAGGDTYVKGTGAVFAGDGTETVPDWHCAAECPVRRLDLQTGILVSGSPGIKRSGNTGSAYGAESRPPGSQMSGFGDSGGASRFFQQVELCHTPE